MFVAYLNIPWSYPLNFCPSPELLLKNDMVTVMVDISNSNGGFILISRNNSNHSSYFKSFTHLIIMMRLYKRIRSGFHFADVSILSSRSNVPILVHYFGTLVNLWNHLSTWLCLWQLLTIGLTDKTV